MTKSIVLRVDLPVDAVVAEAGVEVHRAGAGRRSGRRRRNVALVGHDRAVEDAVGGGDRSRGMIGLAL